jgi:hypothetical protein
LDEVAFGHSLQIDKDYTRPNSILPTQIGKTHRLLPSLPRRNRCDVGRRMPALGFGESLVHFDPAWLPPYRPELKNESVVGF